MTTKRKTPTTKKPPASSKLEQEAKEFIRSKNVPTSDTPLSSVRQQLAASILSGLLAGRVHNRAEELVEEAFRYADLVLRYNK